MNVELLSKVFREVIMRYGELILPFMGSVELIDVPANFSEDGMVVCPPSKRLSFNNFNLNSNNNLAEVYSSFANLPLLEARAEVAGQVEQIRKLLAEKGSFSIDGFATLSYSASNGYSVEADPSFELSTDTYGLDKIEFERQQRSAEPMQEQEKNSVQESVQQQEEEIKKKEPVKEIKADKKESSKRQKEQRLNPAIKALMWVAIIVALIALLLFIVIFFKEPLMPLLEKLLYTKEELEIIHFGG
ncbi:MAG: hypothetical protein IKI67_02900 [Bacteroidales bacterium]|nr:hypothetical protein [Bacteroidales bacterium]